MSDTPAKPASGPADPTRGGPTSESDPEATDVLTSLLGRVAEDTGAGTGPRPAGATPGDLARAMSLVTDATTRTGSGAEPGAGWSPPRVSGRWFSLALVALLCLAPLPVGANRPLIWALLAVVIGLCWALHSALGPLGAGSGATARGERAQDGSFLLIFALALAQPLWGVVQALPLGGLAVWLSLPVALPPEMHPETISLAPKASLLAALRMAGHVAVFALALDLFTRPERVLRAMRWLLAGIVVWAVYAMVALQLLGDVGPWGAKTAYLGSATGPFVNRNSFATFLGIGMVLGVALLLELRARPRMRRQRQHGFLTEDGIRQLVHGAAIALLFAVLLATRSRMGLLASLSGVVLTYTILIRSSATPIGFGRWGVLAVGGAGLAASALVLFGTGIAERSLFVVGDADVRLDLFRVSLGLIAERPLLGFGLDAFVQAFEIARPGTMLDTFTVDKAHSSYLQNWVEGGLIFGSLPLVVGALYLRKLIGALKRRGVHGVSSAAAAGVLMIAAVHSLVDFSFEIEANVLLLCVICAMGVSRLRLRSGQDR